LKEEIDGGILRNLLDHVAVVGGEEPEIAGVIHRSHIHGPNAVGETCWHRGAEEAGFSFIDHVLDSADRFWAAEILSIMLRLVPVN
jgi:hypothetical protein